MTPPKSRASLQEAGAPQADARELLQRAFSVLATSAPNLQITQNIEQFLAAEPDGVMPDDLCSAGGCQRSTGSTDCPPYGCKIAMADRAASAQVREGDEGWTCPNGHKWQAWRETSGCPSCANLAKPAAEPVPVAQDWHVRHLGAGLLALYHGDEYVRDIGGTPGWDFKDRDEFIVRYNAHADHARRAAEMQTQLGRRDRAFLSEWFDHADTHDKLKDAEASLAACRLSLVTDEKLDKWYDIGYQMSKEGFGRNRITGYEYNRERLRRWLEEIK